MTTILSDYNKSILIELLNTNRQIIVVHGDGDAANLLI